MADTTVVAQGYLIQKTITVANGGTKTAAMDFGGMTLVGIQLPDTLTSTAITFECAPAIGGSYHPVYNSAGLLSYTVAGTRYLAIDPKEMQGIQFAKLVCGSAEAAQRTFILMLKGI